MRTYTTSRSSRVPLRSSSPSDVSSREHTKKRPLAERLAFQNTPQPLKRARTIASSSTSISKPKPKNKHKYKGKEDRPPKTLTQLHFTLDTSILRTCPLCDLTYTKGAPEDEILHNSHCARVQRGMQWRRDEEKAAAEVKVSEIATSVKLKDGKSGRVISINADTGGKIGSKVRFNNHYEYSSDEMLNDHFVLASYITTNDILTPLLASTHARCTSRLKGLPFPPSV
jgi:N-acetyltransferase